MRAWLVQGRVEFRYGNLPGGGVAGVIPLSGRAA